MLINFYVNKFRVRFSYKISLIEVDNCRIEID